MANAIVGSAVLLGLASVIGIPIGIGGGIFLAEFGRGTKLANAIRFTADVLNGVPSIVMGVAAYALIVSPHISFLPFTGHFSAFAGGVALGIMMIPTVSPHHRRDAAHGSACGARSGARTGRAQLALGSFDHREDRLAGHHHRLHAGLCARGRRNRAAALYGAGQFLLEHQPQPSPSPRFRCRFMSSPSRHTTISIGWRGRVRWC